MTVDFRPRSIGELLDRAVTLCLRNIVPLCIISAAVLLAKYLAQQVLNAFVYPWLLPIAADSGRHMAASEGRYALNVTVDFVVRGIGVMASAVVIEESVRSGDSDVRSAINEAFMLSGTATVAGFAAVMLLLLVHALIFVNVPDFDASTMRFAYVIFTVRSLLFDLSFLVYAAVIFGLGVVWVHIVLRMADFSTVELLGALTARGVWVRTALGVLATFGLNQIPSHAGSLAQLMTRSYPANLGTYYLSSILGIALFSVLVTMVYLDLCARLAGADIAADLARLTEARSTGEVASS